MSAADERAQSAAREVLGVLTYWLRTLEPGSVHDALGSAHAQLQYVAERDFGADWNAVVHLLDDDGLAWCLAELEGDQSGAFSDAADDAAICTNCALALASVLSPDWERS